jgi:hypothetical protein
MNKQDEDDDDIRKKTAQGGPHYKAPSPTAHVRHEKTDEDAEDTEVQTSDVPPEVVELPLLPVDARSLLRRARELIRLFVISRRGTGSPFDSHAEAMFLWLQEYDGLVTPTPLPANDDDLADLEKDERDEIIKERNVERKRRAELLKQAEKEKAEDELAAKEKAEKEKGKKPAKGEKDDATKKDPKKLPVF